MGIKLEDSKLARNPGPSDYNPSVETYSTKKGQPKISFGKAQRTGKGKDGKPGPGAYEFD